MQIVIAVVVLYFLYRFVTGFLWPVIRTTRTIKKQFNEMRNNMQSNGMNREKVQAGEVKTMYRPKKEYIDFEEVK
jgi:hypothetical protein